MSTQRPTFHSTLGAAFIGFAVSCVLYGVLTLQTYAYFDRFTHDRKLYKNLVTFLWLLETFHQVLIGHTVYHYAVLNYANPLALLFPVWTLISQVLVGAIISVVVKGIFTIRVWRFSRKNVLLVGLICLLNTSILVLALVFTIKAFQLRTFAELPQIKVVTSVVLGISVAADMIIAGSLTYYLSHLRTGYQASNTLVNGLIRYSIETGAITSLCGILTLVFFNIMPLTFVYLSFFFVLSKLYSNSFLATLNTRKVVRGRGTDRSHGYTGNSEFTINLSQTGTTNPHTQTNTNANANIGSNNGAYGNGNVSVPGNTLSNSTSTIGHKSWVGQGHGYTNGFSVNGAVKAHEVHGGSDLCNELDRGVRKHGDIEVSVSREVSIRTDPEDTARSSPRPPRSPQSPERAYASSRPVTTPTLSASLAPWMN